MTTVERSIRVKVERSVTTTVEWSIMVKVERSVTVTVEPRKHLYLKMILIDSMLPID